MAICNIIEDTDRTDEQHELIMSSGASSGPIPPEGCRLACWEGMGDHRLGLARGSRPLPRRAVGPGVPAASAARWMRSTAPSSRSRCSSPATSPASHRNPSARRADRG